MGTKRLQIGNMFQETPPKNQICILVISAKTGNKVSKTVFAGNYNLNSFSSDFWCVPSPSVKTLVMSHYPRIVGGEHFRSVTVKEN